MFPTVGSIARQQVVQTVSDTTVHAASRLMDEKNVTSVIFENGVERYIFSIEDLLRHIKDGGCNLAKLAELSLHILPCISENEHVIPALEILENSGVRYLGVVNAAGLQGILTHTDILAAIDPTILIEKKTVGDLISRTELITFSSDWILEDILCHFIKLEDSVVVVEANVPLGIITSKDVFRIVSNSQSTSRPLTEYMSSPVITTKTTASIQEALMQLKSHKIKRSVVVNEDAQLVGIITQSELVGFAFGTWINLAKHHAGELRELIAFLDTKTNVIENTPMIEQLNRLQNRRMLQKRMEQEIERMRRYGNEAFSLLLIGVEFVKNPVDLAELMPDHELVKCIEDGLMRLIRTTDSLAPWGGKVFAVLLIQTAVEQAGLLAARIKAGVAGLSVDKDVEINVNLRIEQISSYERFGDFIERINTVVNDIRNDQELF